MGSIMSATHRTNENPEMTELNDIVVGHIAERTEPRRPAAHDSASKAQRILACARKICLVAILWVKTCITKLKKKLLGGASDISATLKLLSTVSKLLSAAALTIIVSTIYSQISPAPPYAWIPTVEIGIQYAAVLMMIVGIYQEVKRPLLARWLHRMGHLLFFDGIALAMAPHLGLRPRFIPVLLIAIAVILIAAFKCS